MKGKAWLVLVGLAAVGLALGYGPRAGLGVSTPQAGVAADLAGTLHDEVAALAQSFNQLLDELSQREEEEKRLLADIAHDLRTPLTVLRGDLEALEDGLLPCTPEHLRRLQEEVHLLSRLVEDLRLLTLAENRALPLKPQALDPVALARGVLEARTSRAAAKGVELALEGGAPPLLADPEALRRMLHNLLDNALRHTPEGGRVEVRLEEEGPWVRIAVRDTGPGLQPEERVFQRFYRGDPARTRGGSSLGLSIAKGLVEAMGGRIRAENHPEGGTLFTLWLPRGPAAHLPFSPKD